MSLTMDVMLQQERASAPVIQLAAEACALAVSLGQAS